MDFHSQLSSIQQLIFIKLGSPWIVLLLSISCITIMLTEKLTLKKNNQIIKKKSKIQIQLNCTPFAFPPSCICLIWIHVQLVSKFVDRTNVKCTPKLLWTAEQSMQIKTPYVTEAHVGFFAEQSKQHWKGKYF